MKGVARGRRGGTHHTMSSGRCRKRAHNEFRALFAWPSGMWARNSARHDKTPNSVHHAQGGKPCPRRWGRHVDNEGESAS